MMDQTEIYKQYIEKLIALNSLMFLDFEGHVGDELRDSMDYLWNSLSEENKNKARDYSARLNQIENKKET